MPKARPASRFAVVGAGHGGLAMAAYLALKGYSVSLLNRSPERIEPVKASGGIMLEGEVRGFAKIRVATTDPASALKGAEAIMVVVSATAHRWAAEAMAPHLEDGQVILLNPGRTGGAMEFAKTFQEMGVTADVAVAEAEAFLFESRSIGPAQSRIFRIKNNVPMAALPGKHTPRVLRALYEAFPQFIPAPTVLHTSLGNMGAVFHPTIALLNTGWIEASGGDFEFYSRGITPSVAKVLEQVDNERVEVARALGIQPVPAREWLERAYGATGDSLFDAMHNNEGYKGILAPSTMRNRYILEDVPASLVPIAGLGDLAGVPVPTIRSMIHLASVVHNRDYASLGRTVERLGLSGMRPSDILAFASGGRQAA